jgi:hypothetical protein
MSLSKIQLPETEMIHLQVNHQTEVFRHLVARCPQKQEASLLANAVFHQILVAVDLENSLGVLRQLLPMFLKRIRGRSKEFKKWLVLVMEPRRL